MDILTILMLPIHEYGNQYEHYGSPRRSRERKGEIEGLFKETMAETISNLEH